MARLFDPLAEKNQMDAFDSRLASDSADPASKRHSGHVSSGWQLAVEVAGGAARLTAGVLAFAGTALLANHRAMTTAGAASPRPVVQEERQPAGESSVPAATHLTLPRARLLDRSHFDSYELATFSFLRGIRDDPGRELTRNDWDVQLQDRSFDVRMVVDDRSAIFDLTAIDVTEIGLPLEWGLPQPREQAEVHAGHTYVVLSRDDDSDLATLFQVIEFEAGRSCTLDWITTDGTGRTQGSIPNERVDGRLLSEWLELYRESRPAAIQPLDEPRVQLQLRSGAVGGNPIRLFLGGEAYRVDRTAGAPIDLLEEIPMSLDPTSYYVGGPLREDVDFIVESVTYDGFAFGDTNGRGRLRVVLDGEPIVNATSGKERIQGRWEGEVRLSPGDEAETYLEISNSSVADVVIKGRFEPRDPEVGRRSWAENPGFFEDVTGLVARRLAEVRQELKGDSIVLQVRSARVGGNPVALDMAGRQSIYVDELRESSLDFDAPLARNVDSEAFADGGVVPPGREFLVTSVEYRMSIAARQGAKLVVGGHEIVSLERRGNDAHELDDLWQGRLILRPDEECRSYVEIADDSSAEVVIRGRLR